MVALDNVLLEICSKQFMMPTIKLLFKRWLCHVVATRKSDGAISQVRVTLKKSQKLKCFILYIIQSNLYIKATQWSWKCGLYQQLLFIYRLKLYALFIDEETALYRLICYIEMSFKAGLTCLNRFSINIYKHRFKQCPRFCFKRRKLHLQVGHD